jgi:hypothetical protein
MIIPTLGRVALFHPNVADTIPSQDGACAAIIVYVHGDRMVNLIVFDANGQPVGRSSVPLVQPEDPPVADGSSYCNWLPYQVKKATGSESGEPAAGTQTI